MSQDFELTHMLLFRQIAPMKRQKTLGAPMASKVKENVENINETEDSTFQAESSEALGKDEKFGMNKEQLESMRRAQEEADREKEILKRKLAEQERLYEEQKRKEEEKARKRMENLEKIMMLEIDDDVGSDDDGDDYVEDDGDESFDDDDMSEVVYEDD